MKHNRSMFGRFLAVSLLLGLLSGPLRAQGQQKTFVLEGANLTLQDATADVDVFFSSMRFNRALNVWNFEVSLTNHSTRQWSGPVVLSVDSFTGTTGPVLPDGVDGTGKAFYDLSPTVADGNLVTGIRSSARTLTIGFNGSAPKLVTRVFVRPAPLPFALALTRTLDEAGQPLPNAQVIESGPNGVVTNSTDPVFGVVTLGQAAGVHTWQFSAPGRLPVWRQMSLTTNAVSVVPNPRLPARDTNVFSVTPIAGGSITNGDGSIQLSFPPASVLQATTATLTSLTGQTLPGVLPPGWSPLRSFWVEFGSEPVLPGAGRFTLTDTLRGTETAAFARWNPANVRWEVVQLVAGNGSTQISTLVPGSGAYSVVVPDVLPAAPPSPVQGSPLAGVNLTAPDPTGLTASGQIQPSTSPASRVPEEVTGTATVSITNGAGPMASGLLLRGQLREAYQLRTSFAGLPPGALGQNRTPPQYENFVVAYQRPGVGNARILQAQFPLRPLLLFGAEELDQATVTIDVLPTTPFSGGVLDTNGGLVASQGIGVLAGAGDLLSRQAIQVQRLDSTNFLDFATNGLKPMAAFELTVAGLASGHHLIAQLDPLPTNGIFVLTRVQYEQGLYGLQPVERLTSDAQGRASTAEPSAGERLTGIIGSGQYLLLQVSARQALVSGVAKNSAAQPAAGMPIQIPGQPWLALSGANGAFQLLAPTGQVQVLVTDLTSGDTGSVNVAVSDPQTTAAANPQTVTVGPSVVSINPTNGATSVSRVTPIVVTLSKPVNPGTLLAAGMQLLASNGPVTASLTLNLRNDVVTLLPSAQLDPSSFYTILLSSNISDTSGLRLLGPNSFSFTTESDALNRDSAKLTIYAPGATNIAPQTLANLPGFVPGTNSSSIVAEGTLGTADPGQAVILINETTGETSTSLSKSDGSFYGVVHGGPDDFISATLQNQNGTHTVVRAAEQKFDDGSVGLFGGGGTVQVDGEGGAFQLNIPAGTVRTKTIFRLQPMTLQEVTNSLPNPPLDAQVIAGMKIAMQATDLNGDTDVSLPIDPARIHFSDGSAPEDGAYALAMVQPLEGGGVAYQIVDKLKYANGRLHSNTAPFEGFGDAFMDAVASNPAGVLGKFLNPVNQLVEAAFTVLVLGTRPVTVTGRVGFCPTGPTGGCVDEASDQFLQGLTLADSHLGDLQGGLQQIVVANRTPLSGAFVSLVFPDVASGRSGRLQSGLAYATSDRQGRYALVLPFANAGYVLQATHPRFQEHKAVPLIPFVDYQLGAGAVYRSFGFDVPIASDTPPRLDIAHSPLFPATNQAAALVIDVIHPNPTTVQVLVDSTTPAGAGQATISQITEIQLGTSQKRITASVTATAALTARLKISVTPQNPDTPSITAFHNIAFGLLPPATTNLAIQSDPADKTPPQIERTVPLAGGVLLAGAPISIFFNEPIDAAVAQMASQFTLDDSAAGIPQLALSPDQTRLDIFFAALKPDTQYELTVGAPIKDLAGNQLLLPTTVNGANFKLKFRTLPIVATDLSTIGQGGGVAINGNYAYVLDRTGSGKLLVYDISDPTHPNLLSDTVTFIGEPRDLVIIPAWPHVTKKGAPAQTNDLLAVVGGNLGTSAVTGGDGSDGQDVNIFFQGQYLRVFDLSNPASPVRVLGTALTLRPDAVTKVRWDAPFLAFFETGSDFQQVGLINLQEMFVGFNATPDEIAHFPPAGFKGTDGVGTNAPDGDYVDPGEALPVPPQVPNEFFGREGSFLPDLNFGARPWLDFDFKTRGNYCGVVFREGAELDRLGRPTGNTLPAGYRTLSLGDIIDAPSATLPFKPGAVPKRVFALLNVDVGADGAPDIRNLALVSLSPDADGASKLAVIDITIPANPVLTNLIVLPPQFNLGLAQSVQRRPNGQLALATSADLVLLDIHQLLKPAPATGDLHPAILGIVPGAGTGNISLGANSAGVDAVALGGRNQLLLESPQLQFVQSLQGLNLTDPSALAADAATRQKFFDAMLVDSVIGPARFRTNGGANSTLTPANSTNHYYVLMRAPGGAGATIKLGLQSLNRSGYPLKNKGRDFAPVRAISDKGSQLLKQQARDGCDAPIGELTAYRLAGEQEKNSPFYNLYLSKPFALVYERVSADDLSTLKKDVDRELIWSDFNLEAFIDPEMQSNPVLGPFAARVGGDSSSGLDLVLIPRASVVAESFPGTYIPGPNPPPVSSPEKMPGTFGSITANNGEFRSETIDMILPSRRMPIVFERVLGGQDVYEGPFGRGWDFTYSERLTLLRPELLSHDHRLALVVRSLARESSVAQPGDLLWHTGRGRLVLYTHTNQAPPEVAGDQLLDVLQWRANIRTYYLPAPSEAGIFDPIFEFQDGQFARLTPDGRQYWYDRAGYLQKIYDKYPKNYHELHYNQRGELIKIVDASIDNEARYLELGYYRLDGDAEFNSGLDARTNQIFVAGKIARLRDYTGRVVDFAYSADGVLAVRLGIEGSAANSGEGGRPQTVYLYTDECSGLLQGIVAGGQAPTAPLVSVSMDPVSGIPTGGGGAAGGSVTIKPPAQNSAASAQGSTSGISEPDGAQVAYSFDAHGFPTEADLSGPGNGKAVTKTTYGPYGLLTHIDYPLGNFVDYSYDTNNTLLRARANLLSEVRNSGPRGGAVLTRSIPTYDLLYNLPVSSQTDFNGKTLTIALTSDSRDVHTLTYDNAGVRTLDYNEFGQVEKETTPDGVVVDPTYDSTTGFKMEELRGPANFKFGYDSSAAGKLGVPTSVTPPVGDAIQASYDDRLLLLEVSRGAHDEKRGYDRNGNPKHIEQTVSSGSGDKRVEDRVYNDVGFLQKITLHGIEVEGQAADLITELHSTAQDAWRVREIDFPGGQKKQLSYDHLGNLIGMTLGNYSESYGRDLDGNLTSLTQGGKLTHNYFYDGHDRLTNEVSHLDNGDEQRLIGYFPAGQVAGLTINDPEFGTVYQAQVNDIDGLGRPRRTTTSGSNGSAGRQIDYPSLGSGGSVIVTGPRDTFTTSFDSGGRLTERKDFLADITLAPDGNGNILSASSKEGSVVTVTYNTSAGYDTLDHPTSTSDDLGTNYIFTPRLDGAVESVADGEGRQITQRFTTLGEPISKTRESGVQFSYQYNKNRQPTLLGDGTGQGRASTFDTSTMRILQSNLRSGAQFLYNSPNFLNLPAQVTMPGGGNIGLSYDNLGRLIGQQVNYIQGQPYQAAFAPDALGRIRLMNYGAGGNNSATFLYDLLGPLTSASYKEELGTFTVSSTIRVDGSRDSLTYPSLLQVTEDRDPGTRLLTIHGQSGAEMLKVNRYDGAAQAGEILIGGGLIKETTVYDLRRRIQARRYERVTDGAMLAEARYLYDGANNRTLRQEVHRHGRADAFVYDRDNRLVRADLGLRPDVPGAVRLNSSGLQSSGGFAAGLFARAYSYDTTHFDLLVSSAPSNPDAGFLPGLPAFMTNLAVHDSMLFAESLDSKPRPPPDPLGNTVGTVLQIRQAGKAEPTPVFAQLIYNGLSHLVHVGYTNNGDIVFVDYGTQPNGLISYRKLTRNGIVERETALVYDNGRLLEEQDHAGSTNLLRARYYYADEDSPFAADLDDGSGNLQRRYFLRDAQGSVMAVADSGANVVERVSYDAWGQPLIQARDQAAPRISAVIQSTNNELLVEFSESVLPPLSSTAPGNIPITTCVNLQGSFQLTGSSGPLSLGPVSYEEDLPGFPFGTVIRLRPQSTQPGSLTLSVSAGSVVDEWGLPNPAEQATILLGNPGAVLFQGVPAGSTAPPRVARSSIGSPFLFHGQFFDYDTGLLYLRARFYDPFTGQFLQPDPIPYGDSVNPYAAFANNPATLRDPSGRSTYLKKLLANAQARQRGRKSGGSGDTTEEDPGGSSSGSSGRSRSPHGGAADPDATTEIDQPPIHDLTTRTDTIADSQVDTVVTLRPPGGGGPPTPPPSPTDRVWRGMQVPRKGGLDAVFSQLQQGSLLSPNEFNRRRDPKSVRPRDEVRAAGLQRVQEAIDNRESFEGFSFRELEVMSEEERLAVYHIGGSSDDAIAISTALDPFAPGSAVHWAGFGPGADAPPSTHRGIVIQFEVDRGSGVGAFNFDEGGEVTFFDEVRFRRAWVYSVEASPNAPGGFEMRQLFFFPGRP
jgi:RHS repeat-associated protein